MQLSGLDLAFLCLEGSTRPMHMGALLVFEPPNPVHPERIAQLLAARSATAPQLKRCPRWTWWPPVGAAWSEDDTFAAADHVRTHRLRDPEQLEAVVATLIAEPLPAGRPPWELHVLTGIGGNRFAVLAKLHHALADGTGAFAVAGALLDDLADSASPRRPQPRGHDRPATRSLLSRAKNVPHRAVRQTTDALSGLAGEVTSHARRFGQAAGIASAVVAAVRPTSVVSPVSSMLDSSHRRRWAPVRLDADQLHRARKQLGGTFNDIVLSVVAGGLGSWLGQHGDATLLEGGWNARVFIPVSLRGRMAREHGGGNLLSGYLCELPLGEGDPIARLNAVSERMQRNKAAGPTRGAGAFPLIAGALPALALRLTTPLFSRAAPLLYDTMVTTVPLPDVPLRLDGALLRQIHPIAPLAPGQALSVSVTAYNGIVHIGLLTDADLLPGTDRLATAIADAADELHQACADHQNPDTESTVTKDVPRGGDGVRKRTTARRSRMPSPEIRST